MPNREELKRILKQAKKLESEGHLVFWSSIEQKLVVIQKTEGG